MAHWKGRVEFLLSVIELLFLSLMVEALQGKMCQDSLLSGGVGQLERRFQGKGSSLGNIFGFQQNYTHFAIRQCKLEYWIMLRAVVLTLPACDRRTDRQTELP